MLLSATIYLFYKKDELSIKKTFIYSLKYPLDSSIKATQCCAAPNCTLLIAQILIAQVLIAQLLKIRRYKHPKIARAHLGYIALTHLSTHISRSYILARARIKQIL